MGCIFTEATIVGIALIIIGNIVGYLLTGSSLSVKLPKKCATWNKFYVMEVSLFLTGFITYFVFEFTGINKWYCKNGIACKR